MLRCAGSGESQTFSVEATPFSDMPEGEYTIALFLSPVSIHFRSSSTPPVPITSDSFKVKWSNGNVAHTTVPGADSLSPDEHTDCTLTYSSPRIMRPRPRAKSRYICSPACHVRMIDIDIDFALSISFRLLSTSWRSNLSLKMVANRSTFTGHPWGTSHNPRRELGVHSQSPS